MTGLGQGAEKIIIVTAADAGFFNMLEELISSVRLSSASLAFDIGCFDLGLKPEQVSRLQNRGVIVVNPTTGLKTAQPPERSQLGFLARPYLRENFPGYGIYVWLDADTWVQGRDWLRGLAGRAKETGAAFVRESDPSYRFSFRYYLWKGKHYLKGYGPWLTTQLLLKRQINAGVYAMQATAPHWAMWQQHYQSALSRTGLAAPHDQFSLNVAMHLNRHPETFLPPTYNWICALSCPYWDEDEQQFCSPDADRRLVHIVHLAGSVKTKQFDLKTTKGRIVRGTLRYGGLRILVDRASTAIGAT
jgi:hypothetical protein